MAKRRLKEKFIQLKNITIKRFQNKIPAFGLYERKSFNWLTIFTNSFSQTYIRFGKMKTLNNTLQDIVKKIWKVFRIIYTCMVCEISLNILLIPTLLITMKDIYIYIYIY